MKLISLNIWGGKKFKPLINFIKNHSKDTDIFCFQEIFSTSAKHHKKANFRLNLYQELSTILKDFNGYFAPTQDKYIFFTGFVEFDLSFGLAIFVKKGIKVSSNGDFFVFLKRNGMDPENVKFTIPRNLQFVEFNLNGKKFIISNLHGIWVPAPKTDTPSRIEQSKKIIKFLDGKKSAKILCGDFNLDINSKSLKLLDNKLKNLIKEFKIPTTRSRLYDRTDDKFADYTFVSSGVNIINFQVPNIDISDHLPMILEFS